MSTNPNRCPAGTPEGGQFAPGPHPESGLALSVPEDSVETEAVERGWRLLRSRVDSAVADLERAFPAMTMAQVRRHYPGATRIDLEVDDDLGRPWCNLVAVHAGEETFDAERPGGEWSWDDAREGVEPLVSDVLGVLAGDRGGIDQVVDRGFNIDDAGYRNIGLDT